MQSETKSQNVYDIAIRLVVLAMIIAYCLMVLLPFGSIVLWSIILTVALMPLHTSFSRILGGRPKLASIIIVIVLLALIMIPGWLFLDSIIDAGKQMKANYDAGTLTIPPPPEKVKSWPLIGDQFFNLWNNASINLENTILQYKDQLIGISTKLLKGVMSVASGGLQMIGAIIIAGFLLVIPGVAESFRRTARRLVGERGDEFTDIAYKTVGNVVKGILGVAFIQSLLTGLGFLLAGVPFFGLWTLLVFILAVLQIPAALVVIPVIIWLFSSVNLLPAILWTLYLLVAGLSDNVLKPILLGKGAPVPMLVIFLGVIGGFVLSGFIGLFTGAIIVSLGYKLFQAWVREGQIDPPVAE